MSDLVYQNYSNKCRGWSNPFIGPQITNLSGYQSSVSSTSIITINGYNFYPYSRIVFGTLNPTTYFVNSTILRFYIPVNLTYGIYPVQVFNESIGSNIVTYTLNDTTYVLTKSEADTLYLSKVNTDTSTAPLTTFNGELIIGSTATFNGALTVGSNATFYSYAPVCGITATSGNQLVNKDYVDNTFNTLSNTFNTLNNILNFSSNAFTNVTKSIVYNFNTTTTITKSNVKAKLDNYTNIQQVYTFGQHIPNRWVAVGSRLGITPPNINTISYSSDGLSWIGSSSGNSIFSDALGVAWNGTMWVAVGSGSNKIAYSSDGITWIGSSSGNAMISTCGYGVAWNGNMWVAVGQGTNTIAYSSDGITWIGVPGSTALFSGGFAVAWNGTMWIAVGGGSVRPNTIVYSYDGINWKGLGNSLFNNWGGKGVAWNGTMWVAVGEKSPSINYSYDGLNWISANISNLTLTIGNAVAWNGKMWVVVGGANGSGESTYTITYSYDGINWTGVTGSTDIFKLVGNGVAWNGTMWTAVGGTTTYAYNNQGNILSPYTIAYSYNGVDWTGVSGSTGIFQCSGTGIAFNSKRPNTITFPTNLMVKVGSNTPYSIAYSYNGNLWAGVTGSQNSIFSTGNGVAWNGTMWVAVGQGTNSIAYSYNGVIDWVGVTGSTSLFTNGTGVAWNETMWVAVGQGTNSIAYSSNGLNWIPTNNSIFTSTNPSNYRGGYGVAWNGQMWVAVGGAGVSRGGQHTIAYSSDGINWNPANNSIFTRYGRGIAWNGIMWVAVGNGGNESGEPSEGQYTIAYSSDGINWIGITNSYYNLLQVGYGVAWNGTMWVAVGYGPNTFVYSYNGTQWYPAANQSTDYWLGISWNGNQWIAVTINGINNAYSSDGINWTLTSNGVINGNGIAWNAGLGSVNIPNDSIVLNQYGSGLSSELDVVCDSYYNTGFTNCSISINSTN
jgi:hypothetical protein